MLDHVGVHVSDFARAKAFYLAALAPLGYRIYRELDSPGRKALGLAAGRVTDFWIHSDGHPPSSGAHIAFVAADREKVEQFYKAGLAAGGRDNGPPGERPQYSPGYYAAFVLDPDGHNVEAVCRLPV